MNTVVKIPHTLVTQGAQKLVYWLMPNKEGNEFKKLNELYLKYRILYHCMSENIHDTDDQKDLGDYDPFLGGKAQISEKENIIVMMRLNLGPQGSFYYFQSKFVLEELKKSEYGGKIDMIYSIIPNQPLHFYNVVVTKPPREGDDFFYHVYHVHSKGKVITYQDWVQKKFEVLELNENKFPNPYKSKSTRMIEKMRSAANEMMR